MNSPVKNGKNSPKTIVNTSRDFFPKISKISEMYQEEIDYTSRDFYQKSQKT